MGFIFGPTLLSRPATLLSWRATLLSRSATLLSRSDTLLSRRATLLSWSATLLSRSATLLSHSQLATLLYNLVMIWCWYDKRKRSTLHSCYVSYVPWTIFNHNLSLTVVYPFHSFIGHTLYSKLAYNKKMCTVYTFSERINNYSC